MKGQESERRERERREDYTVFLVCSLHFYMSLTYFKIKKTLTLPAPGCELPAWPSTGFPCMVLTTFQANDWHHWYSGPRREVGPCCWTCTASRGHQVSQAPHGGPECQPAHGFPSSSKRDQGCHTKVQGVGAGQGPCPVSRPGSILYDQPRPGCLGTW